MALAKLVIKCPYCHWFLETEPPDPLYCYYSFEKPHPRSFRSKVVEKILVITQGVKKDLKYIGIR